MQSKMGCPLFYGAHLPLTLYTNRTFSVGDLVLFLGDTVSFFCGCYDWHPPNGGKPTSPLYKKPPELGHCLELYQYCARLFQCCIIPAGHTVSMLRSWTWPKFGQEAFYNVSLSTARTGICPEFEGTRFTEAKVSLICTMKHICRMTIFADRVVKYIGCHM